MGIMIRSIIGEVISYYPFSSYQVKTDGTNWNTRKYYSFGSTTIAMRENSTTLTWLLSDQVNSTTITAAADGAFLAEVRYTSFGEQRYANGQLVTDNLYTGQRQETEIGLDYYVARFYDPVLAHFVQADSIIPSAGSTRGFDRYAYVMNNPINLSDPSGNKPCEDEFGCSGEEDNVVDSYYVPNSVHTSSTTPTSTTRTTYFSIQPVGEIEPGESYTDFSGSGDPNTVIRPSWDNRKNSSPTKPSPESVIDAAKDIGIAGVNASYVLNSVSGDQRITYTTQYYTSNEVAILPVPKMTGLSITNNTRLYLHYALTVKSDDALLTSNASALPGETISFDFPSISIPNGGLRVTINATSACTELCWVPKKILIFRGWSDFMATR